MDFKKLFRKDDKAVSPVIGVILMVAITVILAAAIGSSVFSKGAVESAPQANLDIKAVPGITDGSPTDDSIKFEHLGGEMIRFNDTSATKVMATIDGQDAFQMNASALEYFDVGNVKTIPLKEVGNSSAQVVPDGKVVNIKVIDIPTNQLICDKDVRF